mmetsp:Transcript_16662/g.36432  ORF Transcript_16662/g.36432 Transcript_16662/m.36432 type:complete len:1057 (-) Transcript_16662:135-3305(-)
MVVSKTLQQRASNDEEQATNMRMPGDEASTDEPALVKGSSYCKSKLGLRFWAILVAALVLLAGAVAGGVVASQKNQNGGDQSSQQDKDKVVGEEEDEESPTMAPMLVTTSTPSPLSTQPTSSPQQLPVSSTTPTASTNPPTSFPSAATEQAPSGIPSNSPTFAASLRPTQTMSPSLWPSATPTHSQMPTWHPSWQPSASPSMVPSSQPSTTDWVKLGGSSQDALFVGESNNDQFGNSVALSENGSILLVSSLNHGQQLVLQQPTSSNNNIGRAQAFRFSSSDEAWFPMGSAIPEFRSVEQCPYSVALSSSAADDSTTTVAIPNIFGNGSGTVHIFQYSTTVGDWIKLGSALEGSLERQDFGSAVALRGTRLAVGSRRFGLNHIEAVAEPNTGTVQVFTYNSTREEWIQIGQTLTGEDTELPGDLCQLEDAFGRALAFSGGEGNILAVGAPGSDCFGKGHVTVFCLNSTGLWQRVGQSIRGHGLGTGVALSSDGHTLVTASRLDKSVQTFRYDGESDRWEQQGQKLQPDDVLSDFGSSISLSGDGSTLVVGDPEGYERGRLLVYTFDSETWIQKGPDLLGEGSRDTQGASVAISANGAVIAAGAPGRLNPTPHPGFARVFSSSTTVTSIKTNMDWSSVGSNHDDLLAGEYQSWFGYRIAASANARIIAGGTGGGSSTRYARAYELQEESGEWIQLGGDLMQGIRSDAISLSADGKTMAIGTFQLSIPSDPPATLPRRWGEVRVFAFKGTDWEQKGQILRPESLPYEERFGYSVSIDTSGDIVAVGSPVFESALNPDPSEPGYARVFGYDSNSNKWQPVGDPISGKTGEPRFGTSVALSESGTTLVIGSENSLARVANLYGGTWQQMGPDLSYLSTNSGFAEIDCPDSVTKLQTRVGINGSGRRVALTMSCNNGSDGAAFVFDANNVFVNDTAFWTQVGQTLSEPRVGFGSAISLSKRGNICAVGAAGQLSNNPKGSVSIFHLEEGDDPFNVSTAVWKQMGNTLSGNDQYNNGYFGGSDIVLDDSGTKIVVGDFYHDSNTTGPWPEGKIYVLAYENLL